MWEVQRKIALASTNQIVYNIESVIQETTKYYRFFFSLFILLEISFKNTSKKMSKSIDIEFYML